jgi:hypothetical protein
MVAPNFADIKSAFRATHPDKATPPWSVPMKVWVTVEDDAGDYWGNIWEQMGSQNVFAEQWERQKVAWILKPAKDCAQHHNKRGIMLQDGAGKAYLTWLQRRMRKDMKGRWAEGPGKGPRERAL